jgi:hypothetical protein
MRQKRWNKEQEGDVSVDASMISNMEGKEESEQEMRIRHELIQKVDMELKQPHIFRDSGMTQAENALIFLDFYESLWERLTVIATCIAMVRNCGHQVQEELTQKFFCQEGQILCKDEQQREMMASRSVKEHDMEMWGDKLDRVHK